MPKKHASDARPDQLKLLKLERRLMRPMASTILDTANSKKMKISAIVGFSAALLALQPAPASYAKTIGIDSAQTDSVSVAINQAHNYCNELMALVQENATSNELMNKLENLFILVDTEHSKMEQAAKKVGARLISFESDKQAYGGGGKDDNNAWLSQLKIFGR